MRYSIMLQIVGIITLTLLGAAGLFAYLQTRPTPAQRSTTSNAEFLILIQDDQEYTLFHDSNDELVSWLEDLDCEVSGFFMLPDFRVKY